VTKTTQIQEIMASWGYGPEDGPDKWCNGFPVATEGKRQSPIDIDTAKSVDGTAVTKSAPLIWNYQKDHCLNVENTGASWKVNVKGEGSSLVGGPLDSQYELWQFHAHWGNSDDHGSEHTVDGKNFAAELHLVHWNKKYESPNVAAGKPDGLAVLGSLIEVGEKHEEFDKVIQALGKISCKNESTCLKELEIDCAKLLPSEKDKAFWHYEGSLTTPPLLESVMWFVFQKPMQISAEQMNAMRSLNFVSQDSEEGKMVNNYRPPCPLHDRIVRKM